MALAGFDPAAAADRLEHNDGGSLFHKTYRHLYEGEKRANANRLAALVRKELDENGTEDGEEAREGLNHADSEDGRYWHRTWLQNGHLKYIGCAPGWAPVDHARTRPGQLGVNRPYPSSPIQLRAVGQALVRSPLRSPLVTPPVTKREPTDRQRFPKPCAAVRSGPGALATGLSGAGSWHLLPVGLAVSATLRLQAVYQDGLPRSGRGCTRLAAVNARSTATRKRRRWMRWRTIRRKDS